MLAGVSLASLKKELPLATPVRMISNLAMTAGKGVIGIVEEKAHTPAVKKKIEDALTGLGLLTFLPESKIEPLTALTASAPAFLLVLLEAMVDAGVTMGFSAAESTEFALQTMEGVVALVKESKKHPAQLKNDIASPAGMTIAGLNEMERLGARHAMTQAILAAFEKCKTLS